MTLRASAEAPKMKTVYVVRTRADESSQWSRPVVYASRRARDRAAAMARVIGGLRTHSYNERVSIEQECDVY